LHFVAEPSHLRKYSVDPHVEDSRRVLENDAIRLCFLKHAQSFRPEPAVISLASLFPGSTRWLTGWASGEKRDSPIWLGVKGSDVGMDWFTPRFFEEGAAPLVCFTEADGFKSCFSCGKSKASDPGEEVEMGKLVI